MFKCACVFVYFMIFQCFLSFTVLICLLCFLFLPVCFLKKESRMAQSWIVGKVKRISKIGKKKLIRIYCPKFQLKNKNKI